MASAKERSATVLAENRLRLWRYLADHPCVDCGESDPVVLEFDHLFDKSYNVSQMVSNSFAWETVEREIAKCEVRCASCHLRKTAREQGIYDRKHAFRLITETSASYVLTIAK